VVGYVPPEHDGDDPISLSDKGLDVDFDIDEVAQENNADQNPMPCAHWVIL
jgi:hypothetical protein